MISLSLLGFEQPPRRIKLVRISKTLLVGLLSLRGDRLVRIEGLPADAKIVGVSDQAHFDSDEITLKIESDTFPEVRGPRTLDTLDLQASVFELGEVLQQVREFGLPREARP